MKINQFIPNDIIQSLNNVKNGENKVALESGFSDILKNKLNEVNNYQIQHENAVQEYIQGGDVDMHEVMVAAQEAKLSLQLAVEVRNKLVEAYTEINRIQI